MKLKNIIHSKENHHHNLDSNIDLKIVTVSYSEIISAKLIIGLIFINICASKVFQSVHYIGKSFHLRHLSRHCLGVTNQGLLPPVHWGRN